MARVEENDRIGELADRTQERHRKAQNYTVEKSTAAKGRAKAHVRAGNIADASITGLGSKTLRTGTGAFKGFLKGLAIGIVFGVPAALIMPFGAVSYGVAAAGYMAVSVAIYTVHGARDGYYKAKNSYSAHKGAKVGDKIAAEGNAQAPKVKNKVTLDAVNETMTVADKPKADEHDVELLMTDQTNPNSQLALLKQREAARAASASQGTSPSK